MAKYRFEEIAYNSTEKKKPTEEDKYTYLGLEHLDSGSLNVNRFGTDVASKGEKLIMRKGDVLFGKRRAYQKRWPSLYLTVSFQLMGWFCGRRKR